MRRLVDVSAASVLVAGAACTLPSLVSAAPNPLGNGEQSTSVRLADDGSYRVATEWRQELYDEDYELTFDLAVHDGFRLPDDDESAIPPYLRAAYELDEAQFDGEPVETDWKAEGHRLSVSLGGDVAEGEHEGGLTYTVRGAAVESGDGFRVYLRAGDLGELVIDPSELGGSITGVNCHYRPIAEPCGEAGPEGRWTIREPAEVIVIDVRGGADQLVEPVIDRE